MEKFSLPKRTGLKTKLEKEFELLYQEIGLALLKRRDNETTELKNMVNRAKFNELEKRKNETEKQNEYLIGQLDALDKSIKAQKKEMRELQEDYNERESRNKEEMKRIKTENNQIREQLSKNLSETEAQLRLAKISESKLLRNIQDLENQLKLKDEELKNIVAKFPDDSEIVIYAEKIANDFLQNENEHYEENKLEIMNKIREIEKKFFTT